MPPTGIKAYQVACNILYLLLRTLFQALPCARTERAQTRFFTGVAAAILRYFVQRVDGNIHFIVVLIDDTYHLLVLHLPVSRGFSLNGHAHQTAEFAYTEVDMHDEIARLHFLQFLHGERNLPRTGTVALEIILVEAVEYLVIGKETCP